MPLVPLPWCSRPRGSPPVRAAKALAKLGPKGARSISDFLNAIDAALTASPVILDTPGIASSGWEGFGAALLTSANQLKFNLTNTAAAGYLILVLQS